MELVSSSTAFSNCTWMISMYFPVMAKLGCHSTH